MRAARATSRGSWLPGISGSILLLLGALVVSDRQGLRQEFFALSPDWSNDPVFIGVGEPGLARCQEVADVLVSQEIFSLRWRGWLWITEPGEHRFSLRADERAYLRIDDRESLELAERRGSPRPTASLVLAPGPHPIEVGLAQTRGPCRLELLWRAAGTDDWQPLPSERLFSRAPVRARAWLRALMGPVSRSLLSPIGWILLIGGLILLVERPMPVVRRAGEAIRKVCGGVGRWRWCLGLALLAIFWLTCWLTFPFTTATADGDDVRYMDGALFNKQMGWNMNRYAHIYLLKGFIQLAGGDVFQASRLQWSFLFGVTMASLALAVASLEKGLSWRTMVVVLFLVMAQPNLLGGIGVAYADFTAMMFVAMGLAVYLHAYSREPPSSWDWHALALGALTIGAGKSKEPGAIMVWFLVLLLWSDGRIDLRQFARRFAWWVTGAVGAYLFLMTLDAVVLGDFWFSLRPRSFAGASRLLEAAEARWQVSRFGWLQLAWTPGPLRALSALSILAAVAAFLRRRPVELRLVALTPLVFIAMMVAVHPPTLTPRYLFPIVPVACFTVGMMLQDLGLGRSSWKGLLSLRTVLIVLFLVIVFGHGFAQTWHGLERHTAYQRGELTLYPWRVFEAAIEEERPAEISVSRRLFARYRMIGKQKTRERIARMYFRRRHLQLKERRAPEGAGLAVITREDLRNWRSGGRGRADRARSDPSGRIVLIAGD